MSTDMTTKEDNHGFALSKEDFAVLLAAGVAHDSNWAVNIANTLLVGIAIGDSALNVNTGAGNTAVGAKALPPTATEGETKP